MRTRICRILVLLVSLTFLCIHAGGVRGSDRLVQHINALGSKKILSVQDFGAVGDGIHDDTQARDCKLVVNPPRVTRAPPVVLAGVQGRLVCGLFVNRTKDSAESSGEAHLFGQAGRFLRSLLHESDLAGMQFNRLSSAAGDLLFFGWFTSYKLAAEN